MKRLKRIRFAYADSNLASNLRIHVEILGYMLQEVGY